MIGSRGPLGTASFQKKKQILIIINKVYENNRGRERIRYKIIIVFLLFFFSIYVPDARKTTFVRIIYINVTFDPICRRHRRRRGRIVILLLLLLFSLQRVSRPFTVYAQIAYANQIDSTYSARSSFSDTLIYRRVIRPDQVQ